MNERNGWIKLLRATVCDPLLNKDPEHLALPSIIGIYTILAILQNAIIVTGSSLMFHKYGIAISIRRQLADFLLRHILQRIQIV